MSEVTGIPWVMMSALTFTDLIHDTASPLSHKGFKVSLPWSRVYTFLSSTGVDPVAPPPNTTSGAPGLERHVECKVRDDGLGPWRDSSAHFPVAVEWEGGGGGGGGGGKSHSTCVTHTLQITY